MDESHRLQPMPMGYDQKLFNQLYKETKQLRRKLANEISGSHFGVDNTEILSWFDVKFIFVFNKHYGDERLKGYIINALQTYKYRIIKNAYLQKNQIHQTDDISELYNYENLLAEYPEESREQGLLKLAKDYLKSRLSPDAYFIFDLDLNPPPYILKCLSNPEQKKIPKCPAPLLAEYLGIDNNPDSVYYIESLRKEINQMIKQANEYFSMPEVSLSLA